MSLYHPRPRRYPLIAAVELTDMQSSAHMKQIISDLSLAGCHVSTQQMWPINSAVRVQIAHRDKTFCAQAKVIYGQPMLGIGLAFTEIEPAHQSVLDGWIDELRASMQK